VPDSGQTERREPNVASLRPLAGPARDIERLVGAWLATSPTESLTVRTSGSTGEAKQVALSAPALRASATATLARLGGAGGWLLALPAHYVAGLQVIVRSILAKSSPVVLSEHPDLSTATRAIAADRRYLAVVSTQLYRWMSSPPDLEALRRYDAVLVGGAATAPALVEAARAQGVAVVTTYGMSETCGGCVYDGRPLDGVAVALGVDGAIRLAGPVLFDGYDGDPDLTSRVLRDGWLHTSDLGRFDADGLLEVLGRVDDVVMSGGVSVALPAVERRVAAMAAVAQCAVVAVPDSEWGARLVAYVVARSTLSAPDLADVRTFVAQEHPRSWAPRELVVVDALPVVESGKVDRQALRRRIRPQSSP